MCVKEILKSYLVFEKLVLNSDIEEFWYKNRIKILTSLYLQPKYLPNSGSIDLIQTFYSAKVTSINMGSLSYTIE